MNLENPDSEIVLYVLLRAVDRFHKQYNRYPGNYDDQVDGDSVKLKVKSFDSLAIPVLCI